MKKFIFWTLTILLLSGYTMTVLRGGTGTVAYAYAKVIDSNAETSSSGSSYIEVNIDSMKKSLFQAVLDKFKLQSDKEKALCEVSESDVDTLKQEMSLSKSDYGKNAVAVYTPASALSKSDLQNKIPNIHCLSVPVFERFLLLLTSHVS